MAEHALLALKEGASGRELEYRTEGTREVAGECISPLRNLRGYGFHDAARLEVRVLPRLLPRSKDHSPAAVRNDMEHELNRESFDLFQSLRAFFTARAVEIAKDKYPDNVGIEVDLEEIYNDTIDVTVYTFWARCRCWGMVFRPGE